MRTYSLTGRPLAALSVALICAGTAFAAEIPPNTLRVYLLAGQSNMQGHAYTYQNNGGTTWNIPTLEFLLGSSTASTNYVNALPESMFSFKPHLHSSWINPRDDVWGVQYRPYAVHPNVHKQLQQVEPTMDSDTSTWTRGIAPLSPGYGASESWSAFGPELGMGIRLGDALEAPVFLFKANEGGTTLGNDWRPPSAVARNGGSVGIQYSNTVELFKDFLDELDADLADDGKLNDYNDATGYAVSGFFWLQGWNEKFNDAPYTAAQLRAEYEDNLVDLAHDIRAAGPRIPDDLGIIIGESSDQDSGLNASRAAAVARLNAEGDPGDPDTAVFIETDRPSDFWAPNPSGGSFTTKWGYHFYARAENLLEIGWKAGGAALDRGFTGSLVIPEPAALSLVALGGLAVVRRRQRRRSA